MPTSQVFFHLAFVGIFLAGFIVRGFYERRARKTRSPLEAPEIPNKPTWKKIAAISILLLTSSFILSPGLYAWARIPLPQAFQWLELTLGLISLGLLLYIHRSLGTNFSNSPEVHYGNTFIRSGPYRWVRHPIYSTILLLWVAILLLTLNLWFGGLFLVAQWITVRRHVPHEEANLRGAFDEPYEAYAAATGRFLPRSFR